jgi:hypothetical protein
MRLIATALTVALASTVPIAVRAAAEQPAMTARDLAQLCSGSDHVSRNACRIYILGVTQGIAIGVRMAEGRSAHQRPCVPASISAETLEQTVKKRLATLDSSTEREGDAAGFIGAVVTAAYPCAKTTHQD